MFKLPSLSLYDKAIIVGVMLALLGLALMPSSSSEPITRPLIKAIPASQRLVVGNEEITGQEFFSAYTSHSIDKRRSAELYLLGVLDSTEGVAWCGYQKVPTSEVADEVHRGLKSLSPARYPMRASQIVAEILSGKYPCPKK